jgi:hypothetical protein
MRIAVEMDITEKEHKHGTIRGCQPPRENLTIQQITLPTNRCDLYTVPYKTHKPLKQNNTPNLLTKKTSYKALNSTFPLSPKCTT